MGVAGGRHGVRRDRGRRGVVGPQPAGGTVVLPEAIRPYMRPLERLTPS